MRSDRERNSITKSGQIGANASRSSLDNASQRFVAIQEASGPRFEPSGSVKSTDESNVVPPQLFAQRCN